MFVLRQIVIRSLQRSWIVSSFSMQPVLLRSYTLSVTLKSVRGYHSPKSYGIEAANSHVFEDLRKVYKSTELDILCSLQTRYPECTVTMAPASTGLIEYAKTGEATASLILKAKNCCRD